MGLPDQTNLEIIDIDNRNRDGNYEILGDFVLSFRFEVKTQQQLVVNAYQFDTPGQSFSIRCWISTKPNGIQLFERFHPGTGSIYHNFFDQNISPEPTATIYSTQRNEFSAITYEIKDNMVPLETGIYYYNVHNLERRTRGFHINFVSGIC